VTAGGVAVVAPEDHAVIARALVQTENVETVRSGRIAASASVVSGWSRT
jgi:hypothetical protein